jgi:hypothetical protein
MGLDVLLSLSIGLLSASVLAIGVILAQLRRKPRMYTPYLFLAAIAMIVVVDRTRLMHSGAAVEIETLFLILLSGLTFVEYTSRDVHPSHLWTVLSTCLITIAWCVMAVYASACASV